jgi:predicted AAA+ superfamily ATPase
VFLRDTLLAVLRDQRPVAPPAPEVARELLAALPGQSSQAIVLKGVRRCGKSCLQAQMMRRAGKAFYCNLEDTRLFGLSPEDFPTLLSAVEELAPGDTAVFLDEVQEVPEWERLVRSLLDRGRPVCVTGSNASLLGPEVGAKLTGRHLSFEVFPFSYGEYLAFAGRDPDGGSLLAYLDDGGFPGYLRERTPAILRELLRDIVQRDIALRHGLRETRHVMNLALFLLANTGQPFSMQSLTKSLGIPGVSQTSRYLEYLQDAYLLFSVPRFSPSFKQRTVSPNKYYANDNGLRRVNSPQTAPDRGHRLENLVFLALRQQEADVSYAGERDLWECDFVTTDLAIQVCAELTPYNRRREVEGALRACRLPGRRRPLILTLDQHDRLTEGDTTVEVRPVWEWLPGKE